MGAMAVEASTRMPARKLRSVAGNQRVPIGIERPHVDASAAHAVENIARGNKIAEHLAVQDRPLWCAVAKQVMAEGVESRMGVRDGIAGTAPEGVFKTLVGTVLAHDQIRAIHGAPLRPGGLAAAGRPSA